MADWAFLPANTAPVALDIIWCRFPLVEDPASPGPKPRPGLVRQVKVVKGRAYVEVAYGTSKLEKFSDADLFVANLADMIAMGLPQATVFQLSKTITIPWAEEWVGSIDGHGPKIGHLTPKYCEYLAHLQQRLKRRR